MRDDRDFSEPGVLRLTSFQPPNYAPVVTSSRNMVRSKTRTFRSESQSTMPLYGYYFQTTAYSAFFSTSSSNSGVVSVKDRSPVPNRYEYEWDGGEVGDVWRYGCTSTLVPSIPAWLISQVRGRILSRIRNSDLNIGTSLAEMKSTVEGINNILRDILDLVTTVRTRLGRFEFRSKRQVLRYLRRTSAGKFLEFNFGLLPLMNDVYNLTVQIGNIARQPAIFEVFEKSIDPTYGPSTWPSRNRANWLEGRFERGMKAGYNFTVASPEMFDSWRYGLTNPATVIWELLPYSFVVDWFTNLGSFIDGLSYPSGCVFSSAYETTYVDSAFTRVRDVFWHEVGQELTRVIVDNSKRMEVKVSLRSSVRTSPPSPPSPPAHLSLGLNTNQAANFVALILAKL